MSEAWQDELLRLALLLIVALVIGAATGATWPALAVALAGYLVWHLRNLWRLEAWLRHGRRFAPPEGGGIWGIVMNHYWRVRRHDRARQRRLARVVRAVRDVSAAMPEGTVLLDEDRQIVWFNRTAGRMLSLRAPQDIGQYAGNLVRHPDFVRLLGGPGGDPAVEIPAPGNPGAWVTCRQVAYGDGQALLLVQDTTRLRRLEEMRREFVANASHELRSPLTVIRGYLEAMQDDPVARAEWAPQLAEMRRQSGRMASIIEDLLELSRLETDASEPAAVVVDVPALVHRLREEALALGEGPRDVRVELATQARLLGADRELHSAFGNLVFNAMRYTPAGGSVHIRWTVEEGAPCFSVTDTGIGIEREHIPRITERFYRADAARARSRGGTGLGLAIVKHVVQRHGGRLEVASQPGVGSTFTCRFPVTRRVD